MREVDKMSEKREIKNNKNTGHNKTAQRKNNDKHAEKKYSWKGFFEEVTYSSGPGDNIFIFG